ncbi:hypothetical protein [Alkalilimnicola sp. S0819]|uniref:hypothetical protein n=1 Tax=Alkalilimnicola sp. S0819 TaxID=2613922 RepID=UPI001261C9B0|nr:hypothetical protein [Alkalilimnicola sp. S0819]KAB7623400.1 hypothetical protein F3N43_09895 [Alkalilimnicola sp. S0819]MPQ16946.1 hypothetical protein [Alkalilimnicola sp. S0819]
MTDDNIPYYHLLREGTATKLGQRAQGTITYRWLADPEHEQLFVALTGNESGGYFSREIVPFQAVEACFAHQDEALAFRTRIFRQAFVGKSTNNAGFLAAILRAEGLLGPAPEAAHEYVRLGNWAAWTAEMLQGASLGTVGAPPSAAAGKAGAAGIAETASAEDAPDAEQAEGAESVGTRKRPRKRGRQAATEEGAGDEGDS